MIIPAPVKKKKTRKEEGDQEKEKKKAVAGMDHLRYLAYVPSCIHPHVPSFHKVLLSLSLPALASRACGKPEHVLGWLSGIIIC